MKAHAYLKIELSMTNCSDLKISPLFNLPFQLLTGAATCVVLR